MTAEQLLRELVALADDAVAVDAPSDVAAELTGVCATARLVFDAAAVSIAAVDPQREGLRYVAADGVGASEIVGVTLAAGSGLANLVAASGQSMAIDRVADDPRFAREVAESTGYVPEAMLLVPVLDDHGEVAGVLSVLDRQHRGADDLAVAGSFARLAAPPLQRADTAARVVPVLLRAAVAALGSGGDLAAALADAGDESGGGDEGSLTPELLALLAQLRRRRPDEQQVIMSALSQLLSLSSPRRR